MSPSVSSGFCMVFGVHALNDFDARQTHTIQLPMAQRSQAGSAVSPGGLPASRYLHGLLLLTTGTVKKPSYSVHRATTDRIYRTDLYTSRSPERGVLVDQQVFHPERRPERLLHHDAELSALHRAVGERGERVLVHGHSGAEKTALAEAAPRSAGPPARA